MFFWSIHSLCYLSTCFLTKILAKSIIWHFSNTSLIRKYQNSITNIPKLKSIYAFYASEFKIKGRFENRVVFVHTLSSIKQISRFDFHNTKCSPTQILLRLYLRDHSSWFSVIEMKKKIIKKKSWNKKKLIGVYFFTINETLKEIAILYSHTYIYPSF